MPDTTNVLDIGGTVTVYAANHNPLATATFTRVKEASEWAESYIARHVDADFALYTPHTYMMCRREECAPLRFTHPLRVV
jgi:hypothetical protein